jgi:sialate O-acetylesterase
MKSLNILPLILATSLSTWADVQLPPLFSDGMVLQRDLPVPVWGTANPGENITVSFAGQNVTTKTDSAGKWMVKLEPLKTSNTGREIVIRGKNTCTIKDVLVGEVWLCAGQSNMADSFNRQKGRLLDPADLPAGAPGIRFFKQGYKKPGTGDWNRLDARSQIQLTRVGGYFGIRLYRELGIPIGLIEAYFSSTPIQSWMPKEAAERIRVKLNIPPDWNDPKKISEPGFQFNEKIAPILPVAFRGVVWYQGERNAKSYTGWEYRELLPYFINTWRELWAERVGLPVRNFPFYYVQPSPQEAEPDQEWAWLRDSMRRALNATENTGMAVFYDYGPSLHPEIKKPAGERLALWALARDYGHTNLVCSGPLLDQVSIQGDKAVLSFKYVGGGLKNKTGGNKLKFFEIAGKDAKYFPAEATIQGNKVVVQSPEVNSPVYVRYLFIKAKPDPELSLINAEGLPASSFITDELKPPRTSKHAPTPDR